MFISAASLGVQPPKAPPIDLEAMARAPSTPRVETATEPEPPAAQPETRHEEAPKVESPKGEKIEHAEGPTRLGVEFEVRSGAPEPGQVEVRKVFPAMGGTLVDKWRHADTPGERASAIIDVRTGLKGTIAFTLDRQTVARLGRLTRARLGKMSVGGDEPSATRIVIELVRGSITVWPAPGTSVNVLTPDGLTVVREGTTVSHDAVHGTRAAGNVGVRPPPPPPPPPPIPK